VGGVSWGGAPPALFLISGNLILVAVGIAPLKIHPFPGISPEPVKPCIDMHAIALVRMGFSVQINQVEFLHLSHTAHENCRSPIPDPLQPFDYLP
jgi:hypothetical protein